MSKEYPLAEVKGKQSTRCYQCGWSTCHCSREETDKLEFQSESQILEDENAEDFLYDPTAYLSKEEPFPSVPLSSLLKQSKNKKKLNTLLNNKKKLTVSKEFRDVSKFMKRRNIVADTEALSVDMMSKETITELETETEDLESTPVLDQTAPNPLKCENIFGFLLLYFRQRCPGCFVKHTPKKTWCLKYEETLYRRKKKMFTKNNVNEDGTEKCTKKSVKEKLIPSLEIERADFTEDKIVCQSP